MAFLTEAANRGSISTGYDIDNSVKLEQPERLNRGYDGAGNIGSITATDRKKTTLSYWVKRTQLNASGNGIVFIMYAGNTIMLGFENDKLRVSSSFSYSLKSNADFRDTSAWYNLVFSIDTTQGTANDRVKVYVNGAEYTDWGTQTISISQNANNGMFNEVNGGHYFGWSDSQATGCYVAEAHCIDGQALAASDFGEYDSDSGIWIPKEYTGTYGNQGYYLNFDDSSALGADSSGNGNNFGALYGIGAENQATDTPTNNFATLNLQVPNYANTGGATEGGTKIPWSGVNSYGAFYATQAVKAGKWYWEFYVPSRSASYGLMNYIGLHTMEELILTSPYRSEAMKNNVFWLMHYGDWYAHVNGSQSSQNTVAGLSSRGTNAIGKTYAIAFNADDAEMTYYENGTRISNLEFDIFDLDERMAAGVFIVPWFQVYHNDLNVNFGGYSSIAISSGNTDANGYGNFEYAPPTGYYALCSKNLAEFGG